MKQYGLIIYNTGKEFPLFVASEEELDELFNNINELLKNKDCVAYTVVDQKYRILLTADFIRNSYLVFSKDMEKHLKEYK